MHWRLPLRVQLSPRSIAIERGFLGIWKGGTSRGDRKSVIVIVVVGIANHRDKLDIREIIIAAGT